MWESGSQKDDINLMLWFWCFCKFIQNTQNFFHSILSIYILFVVYFCIAISHDDYFFRFLVNLPENVRKLTVYRKSPHQEIRRKILYFTWWMLPRPRIFSQKFAVFMMLLSFGFYYFVNLLSISIKLISCHRGCSYEKNYLA